MTREEQIAIRQHLAVIEGRVQVAQKRLTKLGIYTQTWNDLDEIFAAAKRIEAMIEDEAEVRA